ncbi:HEAT repeat domain-containing protein [Acidobacteriota bacterium]
MKPQRTTLPVAALLSALAGLPLALLAGLTFTGLSMAVLSELPAPAFAEEAKIRTPDEILSGAQGLPSSDAILELFVNASEWDAAHHEVRYPSRDSLIELGHEALPPILENYLSSTDIRRRITLDRLVRKLGYPANPHLIPFLKDSNTQARRHAAYLLGDTCFANTREDPLALGPFKEDDLAKKSLLDALKEEKDESVLRSLILATGQLRDPGLVDILYPYLKHDAASIRLRVAITLGNIPHFEAVAALLDALRTGSGEVRQAAILSLSKPSMGKVGFSTILNEMDILGFDFHFPGCTFQMACLEALARYLEQIAGDDSDRAKEHREKAFQLAHKLVRSAGHESKWRIRGYAVSLFAYSTSGPEAIAMLERARKAECHPFVMGRIDEALAILREKP